MSFRRILPALILVAVFATCCSPAMAPTPTAIPLPPEPETSPTPGVTAAPTTTPLPAVTPPDPYPGGLSQNWWRDGVFYVLLVRSFYDQSGDGYGDLAGLIDKLDYLNDGDPSTDTDLGVTGLWLLPVTRSPTYHGYGTTDYYTLEPTYGDNETFRRLVSEAHRRGIHVLLDLALNHTSDKHPWFQDSMSSPQAEHRDWYVWLPENPGWRGPDKRVVWFQSGGAYYYAFFGGSLPDLNLRNPAVTAELMNVVRFWLRDMGADGFRLDAIRHLVEQGQAQESTPDTHAWLQGFYRTFKETQPNAFAIGEVTGSTAERVPYVGNEVDLCFEFDWAAAAIASLDKGDPSILVQKQQAIEALLPGGAYGSFLALQDHARVITQLRDNVAKARLAATLLLTSPGVPFLWYGEEIGMRGSTPDVFIRRPMQWANQRAAGFTSGRPWMEVDLNYDQVNVADESVNADSLLSHYRKLIRLRTAYSSLRTGAWQPLQASDPAVYAYMRSDAASSIVVVLNLGAREVDSCAVSAQSSPLAAGAHQAQDLLGTDAFAPLEVAQAGAIAGWVPLKRLEPTSGWVLLLK